MSLQHQDVDKAAAVDVDEATIRIEVADEVRSDIAMLLCNAGRLEEAVKFNPGRFPFTYQNVDAAERFIETFAPIVKRFRQTGEFDADTVPDASHYYPESKA